MNHDLNQIERLNLAAQTLLNENLSSFSQIYTLIWGPLIADWSHLFLRLEVAYAAGAAAVVVTLMLWRRQRYSVLALALLEIAAGGAFLFIGLESMHDLWWRAFNLIMAPILFYTGFRRIKEGLNFIAIQGEEWAAERTQVRRWLDVLQEMGKNDKIVEIRDKDRLQNSWSNRFLNAGNCWAMAKFKAGNEKKLPVVYRIRFLSEILFTPAADGSLSAQVDGRTIPRKRIQWLESSW